MDDPIKKEFPHNILRQPKKILGEIGEAEIKQMLDDIEYYQNRIEELEKTHEKWVMICKKCGDDLGIVYELDDGQLSDEQYAKIKELTNDKEA